MRSVVLFSSVLALAGCSSSGERAEDTGLSGEVETSPVAQRTERGGPANRAGNTDYSADPRGELFGAGIATDQWRKARNREHCAPLALTANGDIDATPRSADFSGGWAVAFDSPGVRSLYGFAGSNLDPDEVPSREDLIAQWPSLLDLSPPASELPNGSFAGFGLAGASPYPPDNPSGRGMHSIAYLRVAGQGCLYNVWSHVSREHLETLLRSLVVVSP